MTPDPKPTPATDEEISQRHTRGKSENEYELREFWMGRLPDGERRILAALCERWPDPVNRADLDPVGYKRSSRDAYLQRLAARKIVSFPSSGMVAVSNQLFG